jgi:hypothetical protein
LCVAAACIAVISTPWLRKRASKVKSRIRDPQR